LPPPVRVGLITTWNARCGIAEYSRYLAAALAGYGVNVTVLASFPVRVPEGAIDGKGVWRFFYTGWHQERGVDLELALRVTREHNLDLLHLQYQNYLYPPPFLDSLSRLAEAGPLVVTFHDPCVPPDFPRHLFRAGIYLNPECRNLGGKAGRLTRVIPIGVHRWPDESPEMARRALGLPAGPMFCSFGLGRTRYDLVWQVISRLSRRFRDLRYLVVGSPEELPMLSPKAAGEGEILIPLPGFPPVDTLYRLIHASRGCILYYPEFGVDGVSSAAARIGLGSRRPLILTDVKLTRDLPAALKLPFDDLAALEERLARILEDPAYVAGLLAVQEQVARRHSWEEIARQHVELYREVLGG